MNLESLLKSKKPYRLSTKVYLNILVTQNQLIVKLSEVLKPFDISAEQYNVLRILRGQNGKPINMNEIQERMISKTSNTTRLVDKLLLKEMLTREVCSVNRRKIEVQITQKGLDFVEQIIPKVDFHEELYSNKLTESELETLNGLLEKYRK